MLGEPAALYPALRHTHIALVVTSGAMFAVRGLAVLRGQTWPMHPVLRYLSYAIDTALLGAGAGLIALLGLDPLHTPWLMVKLGVLLLYIVLGSLALKRARRVSVRRNSYLAALLCYGVVLSVALTHSPMGPLRWLSP